MSDSNDDGRGRRGGGKGPPRKGAAPRGGPGAARSAAGGKPKRFRDDDKQRGPKRPGGKPFGEKRPYRARDAEDGPRRTEGPARSFRPRDTDRPDSRASGEKRPYRARSAEDGPRRTEGPARSFRPRDSDRPDSRASGEKRPYRDRGGEDRPRRTEGPPRSFRPRDADRPDSRSTGEKRPYRAREGEDRPRRAEGPPRSFRPRDGDRPDSRSSGEKRPYRGRDSDDRPRRTEGPPRSFRPRDGEGERSFRPRDAEERPWRPRRDVAPPRPTPAVETAPPAEPAEERIAKVIARAGLASRRDAEAMIAEGRVTLNGAVLDSPAINVGPGDVVTVDGERLPEKERTRLWIFHKPRGLVTTARDPQGRPTVFENLPEELPRVVAIGRLDINTEGLLLLTNDGGLAKVIAHPDTGWLRRYRVRAHGDVDQASLDRLADGVTVDGMEYGPVEARLDRAQGDNVWITLGLREGKNREVKRILEQLGLEVNRLIRLSFGPFQLGDLEVGLVEEVRTKVLKDQLGAALAAEAHVDFESPVREPIAPFGKPPPPPREERPRERRPLREERGHRPAATPEERPRPDRFAPRRSVWRAEEDDEAPARHRGRHREDPRRARAESGERPRERAGTITREGRTVRVERLVTTPVEERRPPRRAPGADDRPRRPAMRDRAPDGERRGPPGPKGKPRGGKPGGPKGKPRGDR